jgi:AsmA protein
MRRWLARTALLLAGLLLIALGGVWYLAASLDLVALEAELALAVRERTGHDLRVEGLELLPLPLPTIVVRGVELSAAPGFGPEPMLRVERAAARLELLPLLRGELELGSLRLDGLALRLERSEAGRGSWQTLSEHLGAGGSAARSTALPPIERLVVWDAELSFVDGASAVSLGVDLALLELAPLSGPGPSQLRVLAELTSAEPALEATIALLGTAVQEGDELVVSRLGLDAVLRGEAVPGGELALELSAPFVLDASTGGLRVDAFALAVPSLSVSGSLLRETDAVGTVISGRLAAESADPRALLRLLDREPGLEDPGALARASLASSFTWDGEQLELEGLRLKVDDTSVSGEVSIGVGGARSPALWLGLDADSIDLDRYAMAPGGSAAGSGSSPLTGAWLGGRLGVGRLHSGGLLIEQLELPFTLQRGALEVDGASARLLGGAVQGGLSADLGAEPPRYRVWGRADDLDLVRLIEASGSERDMVGRLDLDLELLATGQERAALLASLDGRFCVAARDGSMPLARREGGPGVREGEEGWRARLAQERFARIREQLVEHATAKLDAQRPERLVFTHMGACFTIEQGLARSDDLLVDAERLRLEGAGELDLPAETLDIACSLTLEGLPPMALGIRGPMDDPQVALDKPGALDIARHRVEQRRGSMQAQVEQQREQLKASLQAERQDLRDDLRGKSGEGMERLLDHREQTLERRDERRQQVQEAGQGLRDQLRGTRQTLRDGRSAAREAEAESEELHETSSEEATMELESSPGS